MKLVSFQHSWGPRIGALTNDLQFVIDLAAGFKEYFGADYGAFADMLALMEAGPRALDLAHTVLDAAPEGAIRSLADIKLLAPVPVPSQMRDFSVFEKHLIQCGQTVARLNLLGADGKDPRVVVGQDGTAVVQLPKVWYEQPLYYKQNRFSVVGTEAEIEWPPYSNIIDYELEFGVFIGKAGRDIPVERAAEHIFGYCIFNDFSARDAQLREAAGRLGPAKGKDFDTGNAMGPWLVTKDELPDPYALEMVVRVNGEERGRGNSRTMHHRFEDMIAHVSASETLHVGEFLGSGTVGNGCGLESGRFLAIGDVVELEVAGLGILRNRVVRGGAG